MTKKLPRGLSFFLLTLGLTCLIGCSGGGQAPAPTPDVSPTPTPQPADDPTPAVPAEESFEDKYGFSEERLIIATELHSLLEASADAYQVIDLRNYADYLAEHIEQAVSSPGGKQFELRVREVDPGKTIVLVSNSRYENVGRAMDKLLAEGYDSTRIFVLRGGLQAWMDSGYYVEVDPDNHC